MDAEGRLVFWKSGLWEGGAPTLTCNTCKKRRADRMTANERMTSQGWSPASWQTGGQLRPSKRITMCLHTPHAS
ncbi:hypothetical protein RR48_02693 [Papilio machaon]|uniref:Uncharacterized protein n=1 Tax=Papilio machaon TaxID=76193 RepID=A0A0N1IGR5_PAPMA|nr:hypothetical protein RR48_02693 [Papilio machaon]